VSSMHRARPGARDYSAPEINWERRLPGQWRPLCT
jgi:hypothetical protein